MDPIRRWVHSGLLVCTEWACLRVQVPPKKMLTRLILGFFSALLRKVFMLGVSSMLEYVLKRLVHLASFKLAIPEGYFADLFLGEKHRNCFICTLHQVFLVRLI